MNEQDRSVRPETLALDELIKETIARVEASPDGDATDTMLFLGNRHQSFPTAVIKDPVLEPVDKLVWMVIMLAVRETGGNTAFPGYDAIAGMANVSSRSTIARAIAILRASRWLTLCGRMRKASGRFRGNVYALHDEPLPLADVIHLDRDYMAFLDKAVGHGHARVRTVAQGVLASIDEDVLAGQNVCAQEHPIERRIQSMVGPDSGEPRRFFSFTRNVIQQIRHDAAGTRNAPNHHDQNLNTVESQVRDSNAQNSNSGCSSSNNKKTTTTPTDKLSKFVHADEHGKPLVYPGRLCDNQRDIANRYLRALSPAQRQPILDELEGRFLAEQKGMRPVYDEISFLIRLCDLTKSGDFLPNLGIKVRDARRAREARRDRVDRRDTPASPKETEEQRQRRMAVTQERVAEMRKALGMPRNKESLSEPKDP
ncbi:MAG: STY4528 family pathogenicity island replication protein [Candidatus Thiodiazotropha endolucinida]|nr:STY4528 family pathogenicity island replication protein [Candidatus Thiodiazotropha taylori]MCG7953563.1 STY4528 family pathogenicity island replication protein [Candidatus Thiodiazotropha taylori]MCG8097363.1 STY4528 family pathogenicity island replication protein [Candidatus Thiodiazotropha endolucinida]MCW4268989.1 STY4528 family pathogenicity island replication protein [Candidatus Thiodiazotropha endolucinida]MCW4270799.1 STY4528 family pathogenicity island replication protein [Candidatu